MNLCLTANVNNFQCCFQISGIRLRTRNFSEVTRNPICHFILRQLSNETTQNKHIPTEDKYLSCSTFEERIESVLPPLAATPVRIIEATELRSIAEDLSKTALFTRFFHVATGNLICLWFFATLSMESSET